ncbi:hypothetical protein GR294_07430 [Raoultella sp. Lac2]|uniref:right-handed parallel beta-helix repeat-containing protein n=1 Tax=unclassified Raoultella TaxID=2627600 RepID=UPI0013547909|nr:hypothetical protein [Raoultella sp. Lac2]MXF99526.1 hypothetical protein [Raoultella sp. Lac1]
MNRRFFVKKVLAISAIFPLSKLAIANEVSCVGNGACTINILDYGCRIHQNGNQYFDNRKPLQNILDACSLLSLKKNYRVTIYIPKGVFFLSATTSNENVIGAFCLLMRSNLVIKGEGTLKLLPRQYGNGAYFRILASDKNNRIENCDIIGITFDGNSSLQTDGIQASNILLECKSNIKISKVTSINANGNGILVRGGVSQDLSVTNVTIDNCVVNNCKKIGIQVSQFRGLSIHDNAVSHCGDNGIDIYGDLGKGFSNVTNGNDFSIFNNEVSFCLNGVFPETVSNGKVYNNNLSNMKESGVHVNRIHGLPNNITIEGNSISHSSSGMYFTGDMKNVIVNNNELSYITDSFFSFGGGKGNASGVKITNNTIFIDDSTGVLSSFNGQGIRNINIDNNKVTGKNNHRTNIILNRSNASHVDNKTVIIK